MSVNLLTLNDHVMDFELVDARAREGAAEGLLLAAEHVLQVSNTNVPIEESTLEGSGQTSVDDANLVAAVTYDTPYAARQHEELDWEHNSGRTAKFLENALNSEIGKARELIAREISSALGM